MAWAPADRGYRQALSTAAHSSRRRPFLDRLAERELNIPSTPRLLACRDGMGRRLSFHTEYHYKSTCIPDVTGMWWKPLHS